MLPNIIPNKLLYDKWRDKQNLLMSQKINQVRSNLNNSKPKSFNFSKGKPSWFKTNLTQQFLKSKNDSYMFHKLEAIYSGQNKSINFSKYRTSI